MKFTKKQLSFIVPLLVITFISAAIVGYYGLIETDVTIERAVEVSPSECNLETLTMMGIDVERTCDGIFKLTNKADVPITIDLETTYFPETSDIETTYVGILELTKKDVDFTKDVWDVLEDKAQIEYTIVGDVFSATTDKATSEAYTLIYYKDNSDRFDSPAKAILVEAVEGNLPYENDKNTDEYDYCDTGEYLTCHGAKIWYVPTGAINNDGTLDWNQANKFYFETELVQYNSEGIITVYPGSLEFKISNLFKAEIEPGEYTITTNVNAIV